MAMSVVYSNAFGGVFAENRGGVVSIYVPDTQGSAIGLVSSSGVLTDRWVYWPYGEVAQRTGTNVTPLTWLGTLGYYLDQVSKLFYVRARHLRADLARWLTVNPLWPRQQAYPYVGCAPALSVDPTGQKKCIACALLLGQLPSDSDAGPLLICLQKNGSTPSGIRGCLDEYGTGVNGWDLLYPYLGCFLASIGLPPPAAQGCDQCKTPGSDAQHCCYQEFLICLLKCTGSDGDGWPGCVVGCQAKFPSCLAANAF